MFSEDLLNNPSVKGWSLSEHLTGALSYLKFPKVRTGRPDHCRTSHFDNEYDFFKRFFYGHLSPLCIPLKI